MSDTLAKVQSTPVPSVARMAATSVGAAAEAPANATARGVPVAADGAPPEALGLTREALSGAGFDGSIGSTLVIPGETGTVTVAVGIGAPAALDANALRNAGAAFARAAGSHAHLAFDLAGTDTVPVRLAAQSMVEGALLARYRYDSLRSGPTREGVESVTIVCTGDATGEGELGAGRGRMFAGVTQLARDLANTPHSHLNATGLAQLAMDLGPGAGLSVEVFDKEQLRQLGCGGLLGVNAGSTEPPQMVKLTYMPVGQPTRRLGLVGKGLMYDSGGLALKPGDEVHAQMKNDMSGAAAIFAAMLALRDAGCDSAVTAWLMCTDNMPSGTAMALGDVITIRGGTTVEVINTDAEGRLVMADALVLATEDGVDAIVDIATLTGACMRALGTQVAGVIGNDAALVAQIEAAADATDEPVWELPLDRRYRRELDSAVADLRNMGGANAGAITAALFLAEFVGDTPWAHIDIAGTAQSTGDAGWQTAGCSGFGGRLLLQFAVDF
jgi:leucyl aminopeptidase